MFRKRNDKVFDEDESARNMEGVETKPTPEGTRASDVGTVGESADDTDGARQDLVYAELDLVSQNLKPILKKDDDKTEYAEIVYTNDNQQANGDKEEQVTDSNSPKQPHK